VPSLQQGSVIWVTVADRRGKNPKRRPAIVVTPGNPIAIDSKVTVVMATGTFDANLPKNQVNLPWANQGRCVTGLNKPCVAICDWLLTIDLAATEFKIGGVVSPLVLQDILDRLPMLKPDDPADNSPTGSAPADA
jgi:mRNA-degrading endonuclease toxin of MazEF toxin-antitoxin module